MNFHAVSHSFPHRGSGASRARTRWQPYASNVTLSGISRSPSVYLHTPASSVSSISPQTVHLPPICDPERLKAHPQSTPLANALRESQRAKYAAKLVDQAVKTLCETWHPEDIPTAFTACGREALCAQPEPSTSHVGCSTSLPAISTSFSTLFANGNTQLPSPVSPTTRQAPSPSGDGCESYPQAPDGSVDSNLIPIKGFVHEVLRRSRTSTGVLQTALCYLEAVRSKVPELLRTEKNRPSSNRQEAPEPRIIQVIFEESESLDILTDATPSDVSGQTAGSTLPTVRIGDTVLVGDIDIDIPRATAGCAKDESSLLPLPALPSPLCCPRRTFLACLILASKFMQDRSYSNRAWAKLAGLPPREIGRCERALGEALEWRLWVGKIPASSASISGTSSGRTVTRSRSDGDVLYGSTHSCTTSSTAAWATTAAGATSARVHSFPSLPPPVQAPRAGTRGLSRSATVPAGGADRSSIVVDPFFVSFSDSAGYCYKAREAPGSGYDTAFQMDVEPQGEVSPSLSTPMLSYSPMSSASSSSDGSEDRTVQMSMFMDLPTPAVSSFGNNLGPWVANMSTYTPSDPANPYGSFGPISAYPSYFNPSNPAYAAEMEATETTIGPTLTALDPNGAKQISRTLPSFAEVFSNRCVLGNGTQ